MANAAAPVLIAFSQETGSREDGSIYYTPFIIVVAGPDMDETVINEKVTELLLNDETEDIDDRAQFINAELQKWGYTSFYKEEAHVFCEEY